MILDCLKVAVVASAVFVSGSALAEGNLARKCIKLPELVFGVDEAGFAVSEGEYNIETGKCYSLEIKSTGKQQYAINGNGFFRNMWFRKIEAGGMEIKATHFVELEFEDEAEAKVFFVPIVSGSYDLGAAGLEHKGSKTTFNVK